MNYEMIKQLSDAVVWLRSDDAKEVLMKLDKFSYTRKQELEIEKAHCKRGVLLADATEEAAALLAVAEREASGILDMYKTKFDKYNHALDERQVKMIDATAALDVKAELLKNKDSDLNGKLKENMSVKKELKELKSKYEALSVVYSDAREKLDKYQSI